MPHLIRIAVIGGGACTPDEARAAEAIGRGIAEKGAVLVTGGLGGIMEAASKGARAAGGIVVGVLPTGSEEYANPYVDIPIVTGLGDARNVIVVGSADAVIAVGGKVGTLSELAFALKRGTPVVGLDSWNLDSARLDGAEIQRAAGAEDAVAKAFQSLRRKLEGGTTRRIDSLKSPARVPDAPLRPSPGSAGFSASSAARPGPLSGDLLLVLLFALGVGLAAFLGLAHTAHAGERPLWLKLSAAASSLTALVALTRFQVYASVGAASPAWMFLFLLGALAGAAAGWSPLGFLSAAGPGPWVFSSYDVLRGLIGAAFGVLAASIVRALCVGLYRLGRRERLFP